MYEKRFRSSRDPSGTNDPCGRRLVLVPHPGRTTPASRPDHTHKEHCTKTAWAGNCSF